jgi:hypothetical protein
MDIKKINNTLKLLREQIDFVSYNLHALKNLKNIIEVLRILMNSINLFVTLNFYSPVYFDFQ